MTSRNLCSTWLPDHVPGTGHDLGFDGTYLRDVLEHWAIDFDWRAAEERLNSFANRTATIDGTALLSIGTWGDLDGSPYTRIGLSVLRKVLPAGAVPELEVAFAESVRPGAFEEHLRAAGFRDIAADWFHWDTEYPDFAAWWGYDTRSHRCSAPSTTGSRPSPSR